MMFGYDHLQVNENGHLTIGGVDTVTLAREYGTPLYVMDEEAIRRVCRSYQTGMDQYYNGRGLVCYASKAFCCKEIYRVVQSEGLGVDVVSGGELYTALEAGFDPAKICFHGNSKSNAELSMALEAGVGRIVADNLAELRRLDAIAARLETVPNVLLRVKPGIDAHTHAFVQTGKIDSKFGFALETGEAFEAAKFCQSCAHLKLVGLHCHIGSQIFDTEPFALAARVMAEFLSELRDRLGVVLTELNLGGGFGIRYTEQDDPKPYEAYMEAAASALNETCAAHDFPVPFILMEPGRSIVGAAGITLYTVSAVKEIPNVRTYVLMDGGMCDNPRYALYQSAYDVLVANRADQPRDAVVTVGGKCCESGDMIGEFLSIQHAKENDVLAVLATGAYNYAMSMHYNRNPNPPVVFVRNGEARVVVRGETYADLVKNDL